LSSTAILFVIGAIFEQEVQSFWTDVRQTLLNSYPVFGWLLFTGFLVIVLLSITSIKLHNKLKDIEANVPYATNKIKLPTKRDGAKLTSADVAHARYRYMHNEINLDEFKGIVLDAIHTKGVSPNSATSMLEDLNLRLLSASDGKYRIVSRGDRNA
jgi:hypothetical protein